MFISPAAVRASRSTLTNLPTSDPDRFALSSWIMSWQSVTLLYRFICVRVGVCVCLLMPCRIFPHFSLDVNCNSSPSYIEIVKLAATKALLYWRCLATVKKTCCIITPLHFLISDSKLAFHHSNRLKFHLSARWSVQMVISFRALLCQLNIFSCFSILFSCSAAASC